MLCVYFIIMCQSYTKYFFENKIFQKWNFQKQKLSKNVKLLRIGGRPPATRLAGAREIATLFSFLLPSVWYVDDEPTTVITVNKRYLFNIVYIAQQHGSNMTNLGHALFFFRLSPSYMQDDWANDVFICCDYFSQVVTFRVAHHML